MKEKLRPLFVIVLMLILYRIIALDTKAWIPFDFFSLLNFISDIVAFVLTFYLVGYFTTKSFKSKLSWWIVLLISILPAIVFIILFRVLLLIVY